MATETIPPALTPDEWAEARSHRGLFLQCKELQVTLHNDVHGGEHLGVYGQPDGGLQDPAARHALAALCLHGQPFGFTREDAQVLRIAAEKLRVLTNRAAKEDWTDLEHLAARIAALLPPEE